MLDRKLRRELYHNLGMLLAVTSIIAVGVACMVTLGSSYSNLSDAKQLYYAQCQMADFSIELKKVPLSELNELTEWPEVAAIRPRIQQYVAVDLEDVSEPLNGLVLSLPDRKQPIINDIVLRQGGYFTDRRDNEVIVNEAFARYHRLQPGAMDQTADEQPAARAVYRGHGHQQRICLPAGRRARSRPTRNVLACFILSNLTPRKCSISRDRPTRCWDA